MNRRLGVSLFAVIDHHAGSLQSTHSRKYRIRVGKSSHHPCPAGQRGDIHPMPLRPRPSLRTTRNARRWQASRGSRAQSARGLLADPQPVGPGNSLLGGCPIRHPDGERRCAAGRHAAGDAQPDRPPISGARRARPLAAAAPPRFPADRRRSSARQRRCHKHSPGLTRRGGSQTAPVFLLDARPLSP